MSATAPTMLSLTAVRVSDLALSVEFYTQGCGFEHDRDLTTPDFNASIVRAGAAGLELIRPIGESADAPVDHGNMFVKTVLNVVGVEQRMAEASAHGGVEVMPATRIAAYGMTIGTMRDPDGYLVEFVERDTTA